MLEKTLESALDDHFDIVPKDLFEEAQEKAFEELDYEECTEEQCIMMIKEILQVENSFQLVLMEEDGDTHISLTWNDLDKKRVEVDYCEGCKTKQLIESIVGLVDKLVGVKEEVLVKEEPPKKVEPVVVETPKVVPKVVQEPVVQKIEKDKTDGMFVTVGNQGTLLTSTNGTLWNQRNIWTRKIQGTIKSLFAVTYGNGIFVVVGNSGKILTSTDGISWTSRTSGTTSHLQGVTYEAGKFIAVGQSGRIITSTNGISWTLRTSGISTYLFGVTYGNNNFVTVGASGKILTSQDGISWTTRTSGTTNSFIGINFVEDLFIAVGESGIIFTSPDGRDWTSQDSGTSEYIRRLTND